VGEDEWPTERETEPENDILVGYGLHPKRQLQVKDKWREIMDAY
jgi:hypothetical protein